MSSTGTPYDEHQVMMSAETVWMPRKDWHDRFSSLKNVPPIFEWCGKPRLAVVAASLLSG